MTCSSCQRNLPDVSFYERPNRPRGRMSQCKECTRENKRAGKAAYYQRNKKRLLDQQRIYAEQNRLQERERSRQWRLDNPEKLRVLNQQYYAIHRTEILKQKKDYQACNPEIRRANNRKRKARLRNAEGTVTAAEWRLVLSIYGNVCAYCGAMDDMTMDHVIPLARGGTHTADNVVPACLKCNMSKKDKMPWEFGYPRTPYDRMDEVARQLHFRFDY